MKATPPLALLCLAVALILSGCHEKPSPRNQTAVFRLFDLFQPEDLAAKVTPDDVGWKQVEWQAREMAPWTPPSKSDDTNSTPFVPPTAIGFHAVKDIGGLKLDQDKLVGDLTGAVSVLQFPLKDNRGGAESVKFVEVRMSVSGAKQVWLRSEGNASSDVAAVEKWASQSEPWKTSVDVVEGKAHTYRFEIQSNRGGSRRGGEACWFRQ